jgi:hypothetical protein
MTESLDDFVNSCILQELRTKFTLIFTNDKMFANVVYYSDCRTVLRRNGYSLQEHGSAFTIRKGATLVGTFDLGPFSAPFVNSWMAQSGIEGVQGFPVGFNKSDARRKQGSLSRVSDKFIAEIEARAITPAQADCDAIRIFNSNEVVAVENGFDGLYVVPIEACPKDDFMEDQAIVFTDTPDVPFYIAINMRRRRRVVASLPGNWAEALRTQGMSYNYDSTTGVLYVCNTKGASYGFPPSAEHLGLAALDLEIEDWESVPFNNNALQALANNAAGGAFAHFVHNNNAPAANVAGNADWTALVRQFIQAPDSYTYSALVTSESARDAFTGMNKEPEYKMGSNKNKQTGILRLAMLGEAKKKTYLEYARLLEETARPASDDFLLVLMFRMRGLLRQGTDGSVYFATQ